MNTDWEEIGLMRNFFEKKGNTALYSMSPVEQERVADFKIKHYKNCRNLNVYQYQISDDEIMPTLTIICPVCGMRKEVTDYSVKE